QGAARARLFRAILDQAHDPRLPRRCTRGWRDRRREGAGMTDDHDPQDPRDPSEAGDDDWYGEADPRVPDASAWPDRDLSFLGDDYLKDARPVDYVPDEA